VGRLYELHDGPVRRRDVAQENHTADVQPSRQKQEQKAVHSSADYFEALFRARFVKAMKQLQKQTSINALAVAMHNLRSATQMVDRKALEKALSRYDLFVIQAFMRGGKLAAQHVKDMLKNGCSNKKTLVPAL
jgi:hypothetical protein